MQRLVIGHVGVGCILGGVVLVALTRRFSNHAAKLELSGAMLVIAGLVLIGVELAQVFE